MHIAKLPKARWRALCSACSNATASLTALLQGKLPEPLLARVCAPKTGLLPTPKELTFQCSCPDQAAMCKHVAAVLYGVGIKLDQQPELLFLLRQINVQEWGQPMGTPKGQAGVSSSWSWWTSLGSTGLNWVSRVIRQVLALIRV